MTFLKDETWSGQVYSGGWITPEGGDAAVIEPATGNDLGRIGIAVPGDVTRAVKQAAAAQPAWAAVPHTGRAAILRRAAQLWEENAAEIEGWVIRESGKIGPAAQFETHVSVQEIYQAATLPSQPYGQLLPSEGPRLSFAERVPVGVVGVIAPFNFPQILSIRSVAPACPTGCCTCCRAAPTSARR
jgi:benzaldehyde dehydrogenase (NAD)